MEALNMFVQNYFGCGKWINSKLCIQFLPLLQSTGIRHDLSKEKTYINVILGNLRLSI